VPCRFTNREDQAGTWRHTPGGLPPKFTLHFQRPCIQWLLNGRFNFSANPDRHQLGSLSASGGLVPADCREAYQHHIIERWSRPRNKHRPCHEAPTPSLMQRRRSPPRSSHGAVGGARSTALVHLQHVAASRPAPFEPRRDDRTADQRHASTTQEFSTSYIADLSDIVPSALPFLSCFRSSTRRRRNGPAAEHRGQLGNVSFLPNMECTDSLIEKPKPRSRSRTAAWRYYSS